MHTIPYPTLPVVAAVACLCCAFGFFTSGPPPVAGQMAAPPTPIFSDPPNYQLMTFDALHRGGFNISFCTRNLLNCWEIIPPTIVCGHFYAEYVKYHFTTACDRMRFYCHENGWDQDDYNRIFEIHEQQCLDKKDKNQEFVYSRRGRGRGDGGGGGGRTRAGLAPPRDDELMYLLPRPPPPPAPPSFRREMRLLARRDARRYARRAARRRAAHRVTL